MAADPDRTQKTLVSAASTDRQTGGHYGYNLVGNGDKRTYKRRPRATEIIPMNFRSPTGRTVQRSDVTQAMVKLSDGAENQLGTAQGNPTAGLRTISSAGTTPVRDGSMQLDVQRRGPVDVPHGCGRAGDPAGRSHLGNGKPRRVASFVLRLRLLRDVDVTWFASQDEQPHFSTRCTATRPPADVDGRNNVYLYLGTTSNHAACSAAKGRAR